MKLEFWMLTLFAKGEPAAMKPPFAIAVVVQVSMTDPEFHLVEIEISDAVVSAETIPFVSNQVETAMLVKVIGLAKRLVKVINEFVEEQRTVVAGYDDKEQSGYTVTPQLPKLTVKVRVSF